jgi:hypothetical protein
MQGLMLVSVLQAQPWSLEERTLSLVLVLVPLWSTQ